ncbi:MAG: rhomboid family intramembrane serine protease [Candidatus Eisenbacteria bacterium]|nr:rhomboid family intramembrane serine protease [Candidatus Latescibacterota bacterium]MBD3302766.1 rhomboid family intramembrane serine protease [Candidatus Eisenbacteria bacterium]
MRSYYGGGGGGFSLGGSLSTMVRLLIAWNVIFFLVQLIVPRAGGLNWMLASLALIPNQVWSGELWRLVTYMFLHGGWFHIGINMLILWMFGSELESLWGPRRFLKYYFVTGIGAGITNAIFEPSSPIPIVGASGAIYGLLLAFGMYFPERRILLYFLFPIKAKYFVILMGAIEFFSSFTPGRDGVAHLAHLGGLVFGWLYLKDIPMRWFRRGGRRGGGGRFGGTRIYDIRDYRDSDDSDSRWR